MMSLILLSHIVILEQTVNFIQVMCINVQQTLSTVAKKNLRKKFWVTILSKGLSNFYYRESGFAINQKVYLDEFINKRYFYLRRTILKVIL
jgi:hypothetical protein